MNRIAFVPCVINSKNFCCCVIIACSVTKNARVPNAEKETSVSFYKFFCLRASSGRKLLKVCSKRNFGEFLQILLFKGFFRMKVVEGNV